MMYICMIAYAIFLFNHICNDMPLIIKGSAFHLGNSNADQVSLLGGTQL